MKETKEGFSVSAFSEGEKQRDNCKRNFLVLEISNLAVYLVFSLSGYFPGKGAFVSFEEI